MQGGGVGRHYQSIFLHLKKDSRWIGTRSCARLELFRDAHQLNQQLYTPLYHTGTLFNISSLCLKTSAPVTLHTLHVIIWTLFQFTA